VPAKPAQFNEANRIERLSGGVVKSEIMHRFEPEGEGLSW
jgi:hypothetical protein